mmetsp:Transcript_28721/g.49283  ORF Transcript_28721/g.49283 Transcript_28721/m.49283 type:complete len:262 (+) Transcript_28721:223-1008(+)
MNIGRKDQMILNSRENNIRSGRLIDATIIFRDSQSWEERLQRPAMWRKNQTRLHLDGNNFVVGFLGRAGQEGLCARSSRRQRRGFFLFLRRRSRRGGRRGLNRIEDNNTGPLRRCGGRRHGLDSCRRDGRRDGSLHHGLHFEVAGLLGQHSVARGPVHRALAFDQRRIFHLGHSHHLLGLVGGADGIRIRLQGVEGRGGSGERGNVFFCRVERVRRQVHQRWGCLRRHRIRRCRLQGHLGDVAGHRGDGIAHGRVHVRVGG